jgi:hypothetical protein
MNRFKRLIVEAITARCGRCYWSASAGHGPPTRGGDTVAPAVRYSRVGSARPSKSKAGV